MVYDCTKPLGDKLGEYLKTDLTDIGDKLEKKGIVCESEFQRLYSMIFKNSGSELKVLLCEKTGISNLAISYSCVYNMF